MGRVLCTVVLALTAGCTHRQLARNTVTQANTHTDIIYRQVLNDVAASECNPDVLPHFAVVGTGGTLVIDSANTSLGLNWDDTSFVGSSLGLGAGRTFEDGWTLGPVVNPDKLRAMRAALQLTTHGEIRDPVGYELLQAYLGENYQGMLMPGWYCVGRKKDIPKCACYVACCGNCYVWVTPDGLEGLSRLSLVMLNVATLEAAAPSDREATTGEKAVPDSEVLPAPGAAPLYRKDYYDPLQSQIQMSGPR